MKLIKTSNQGHELLAPTKQPLDLLSHICGSRHLPFL